MTVRRLLAVVVGAASLTLPLILAPGGASADDSSRVQWARKFLAALSVDVTPVNTALVVGWQAAENTPRDLFNPLATTLKTDDAVAVHNSHGVRGYRSEAAGIAATVRTVRAYPSTVAALAASNPDAFFTAPGWRRYCNCTVANYVRNMRAAYEAALPMSGPAPSSSATSSLPISVPGMVRVDSRVHGQDRTLSPAVFFLAVACGGFLFAGITRGARREIAGTTYALAASAAAGLLTMNVAGVDLARATERGADAAYGWARDLGAVSPLGLLVCAAALAVLGTLKRDQARDVLTTWALTVWRLADLAWGRRAYVYPLIGWAFLICAGVKVSQTWAPWLLTTIVAVSVVARRKKAVAA